MRVAIREVGPRDGFQNEPEIIATDEKVRLIEALARSGLTRLEVTSFVRADVIPQLADGAEVLERIDVPDDVSLSVLIPNERGLENALALRERFHEVNVFLSARPRSHNRANVNRSIEESLAGLERVLGRARERGAALRGRDLGRLRLPLRGPCPAASGCSRSRGGWSPRARRRSGSATRPGWPTRPRCASSSRPRARRSATTSS